MKSEKCGNTPPPPKKNKTKTTTSLIVDFYMRVRQYTMYSYLNKKYCPRRS